MILTTGQATAVLKSIQIVQDQRALTYKTQFLDARKSKYFEIEVVWNKHGLLVKPAKGEVESYAFLSDFAEAYGIEGV